MSSEPETSVPDSPPQSDSSEPRRELVRPTGQRVLAGVASGLADYWGVSAGWIRVAFLVLAVFGGSGVLLYLGLWVILPRDDETESILESAIQQAREGESWVGVALITVGIVIAVGSISWIDGSLAWAIGLLFVGYMLYQGTPFLAPRASDRPPRDPAASVDRQDSVAGGDPLSATRPPRAPRPPREPRHKKPPTILGRLAVALSFIVLGTLALADTGGVDIQAHHYVGAALAVVAIALLVGTWFGRAKWLILIGVVLLPVAALSRVSDLNLDLSFSDVSTQLIVIDTFDDLNQSYAFDAGDVTFDLRGLAPGEVPGGTAQLGVRMDVGQVTVILPDEVAATVHAEVAIGDATLGDQSSGGFGTVQNVSFDGAGGPFDLNIEVGIGSVQVYTEGTG